MRRVVKKFVKSLKVVQGFYSSSIVTMSLLVPLFRYSSYSASNNGLILKFVLGVA